MPTNQPNTKIDMWPCPHHHHHHHLSYHKYLFPEFLPTQSKRFSFFFFTSLSPSTKFSTFVSLRFHKKRSKFFIGIREVQRISDYGFHLFILFSAHNATSTTYITQSSMLPSDFFFIFPSSSSL